MIKVGDTVRFLNDIGGGKVVKIDEREKIAYVEDSDGFEVPMLLRECVVVGAVNEKTNFPRKSNTIPTLPPKEVAPPAPILPTKPSPVIEETADGDTLRVQLAFFPENVKQLNSTSFECYLVNDSNYYLFYNLIIGDKGAKKSVANGEIEPNLQVHIADLDKMELNEWQQLTVQLIPFKKKKNYTIQRTIDTRIKLPVVKFYKLHSFVANEYFDEPSMLIDLVQESQKKRYQEITPQEIASAMKEKEPKKSRPRISPKSKKEVVEVDLHITELLDTTAGMSSADILSYQLDTIRKTLEENKNKKGQKIVFIHGKGEGVLRKELEKILQTTYKHLKHQDASFKEYGFGATMVIV